MTIIPSGKFDEQQEEEESAPLVLLSEGVDVVGGKIWKLQLGDKVRYCFQLKEEGKMTCGMSTFRPRPDNGLECRLPVTVASHFDRVKLIQKARIDLLWWYYAWIHSLERQEGVRDDAIRGLTHCESMLRTQAGGCTLRPRIAFEVARRELKHGSSLSAKVASSFQTNFPSVCFVNLEALTRRLCKEACYGTPGRRSQWEWSGFCVGGWLAGKIVGRTWRWWSVALESGVGRSVLSSWA